MSASSTRATAPDDQLPDYLKDNLSALQQFSKKLDKVSREIRAVEANLQNCGICLKFFYTTINHGGWIRNKGEQNESHFNRVSFLGWMEHNGKFRLVYGEAEQACYIKDGKTRPRSNVEAFTLLDWAVLIETKAQVRLATVDHLAGFVKALTEHVDAMTTRWDDIPF